jgi:sirohydrochlorin ferrochelatase
MKALVLVAHGSRREASNDEIRELAQAMARRNSDFDKIYPGFLELAEPSIPDAIRTAAADGANDIIVMPYFLSAGRHVVKDIPAEVDSVRDELSNIPIRLAPYLGQADELIDILFNQAESSS